MTSLQKMNRRKTSTKFSSTTSDFRGLPTPGQNDAGVFQHLVGTRDLGRSLLRIARGEHLARVGGIDFKFVVPSFSWLVAFSPEQLWDTHRLFFLFST